jgi:hypothetical protein
VLASWEEHARQVEGANRNQVLTAFEGYYNFWKQMCQNTRESTACQAGGDYCYDSKNQKRSVCLPDWKQAADGSRSQQTGPAADGDQDAIVGMILAVTAVENDEIRPIWYEETRQWADASATAFFTYNVEKSFRGSSATDHRLLKLGACWGGWDDQGNNPSYHSPASYKVMRDYQNARFVVPSSGDARVYSKISNEEWNKLIATSQELLLAVQCHDNGAMVPNWATVTIDDKNSIRHTGGQFSGSGTPQNEYGSEAARTTWRVALDVVLYPHDDDTNGDWAAEQYLEPFLVRLRNGYDHIEADRYWSDDTFPDCTIGESQNQNVYNFDFWLYNAFIYAPTLSALVAGDPLQDGPLVDAAGSLLAKTLPDTYYERCWALLGNLLLNGAMESAGRTLQRSYILSPSTAPTERCVGNFAVCDDTSCCSGYTCELRVLGQPKVCSYNFVRNRGKTSLAGARGGAGGRVKGGI